MNTIVVWILVTVGYSIAPTSFSSPMPTKEVCEKFKNDVRDSIGRSASLACVQTTIVK